MSNPLKRIRVPELGIDTVIEVSDEMLAAAIAEYFRNHPVTVTETDPTVPSWAKQPIKPTYTASEVGALPSNTVIPTAVSGLQNDSGYQTASDVHTAIGNATGTLQPKSITDTGGYYTSDTVDGALQEIGAELAGVNTLIGSGVIS